MLFALVASISVPFPFDVHVLFRQAMSLIESVIYILVVTFRGTFTGCSLLAKLLKFFENSMAAVKSLYMGSVLGKEGDDGMV